MGFAYLVSCLSFILVCSSCLHSCRGIKLSYPGKLAESKNRWHKIIGGQEAEEHAYPWQISLQQSGMWWDPENFSHICGGSIIDQSTILCAAHCLVGSDIRQLRVVAGAHDISVEADETWQISSIEDVIIHANFNIPSPYFNDLSLIKLSTPLHFNDFVGPIKLAEFKYDPPEGTPCFNSGWGKTANVLFGGMSKILKVLEVPVYDRGLCRVAYRPYGDVFEGEVCAWNQEVGMSPCFGDSGGPLFCSLGRDSKNPEITLVGVVSWGIFPCGYMRKPTIFTNVGYFRDWIDENRHFLRENQLEHH